MIARTWHGRVPREQAAAYEAYLLEREPYVTHHEVVTFPDGERSR